MRLTFLPRFSRAEMLFSAKCFAAAMLAMYVASRAGLPRPFWAVLTTYVVANPLAGPVRSKALYRFCGTLGGCTFTVLVVPTLSNAPELLTLVLALWVATCLYIALLDRTARSYVFMLAGYTAALIGFPSVETPSLVFDTAVARVEEIGLGILCATIVHSIVFPAGLKTPVIGLLDQSLKDARQWFANLLQPLPLPGERRDELLADRQRLAVDITQLRLLATHIPFDTTHLRWTVGAIGAMQDRLAALTPALSATEDRLQALADAEGRLPADVVDVLAQTGRWLQAEAGSIDSRGPALKSLRESLRRLGRLPIELTGAAGRGGGDEDRDHGDAWQRALRIALSMRLEELVAGWRECAALRRTIDAGLAGSPMPVRLHGLGNRVLHNDKGIALLSSFAAVLAIFICSAGWIASAWPSGSVAAMMAAVFCSFFATMDDPVPAINGFMAWTLASMPIAALYVLVLLPMVNDFGMLVVVCAPVFLVLGALAARPSTAGAGLAMVLGVTGALALHDTASANFPAFFNSNLAQILGIVAAALVTKAVRTVGVDWSAQRIRRATWRELGHMAAVAHMPDDGDAYAVRMLDRISLLAPRIAMSDVVVRNRTAEDALRDLRVGADIVALQRVRSLLPAEPVARVMGGISQLFRERVRVDAHVDAGATEPVASPWPPLLGQIDAVLGAALDGKPGAPDLRRGVTALVGLRRNLFPDAPAYLSPHVSPLVSPQTRAGATA